VSGRLTLNQRVQGSSPCAPTKPFQRFRVLRTFNSDKLVSSSNDRLARAALNSYRTGRRDVKLNGSGSIGLTSALLPEADISPWSANCREGTIASFWRRNNSRDPPLPGRSLQSSGNPGPSVCVPEIGIRRRNLRSTQPSKQITISGLTCPENPRKISICCWATKRFIAHNASGLPGNWRTEWGLGLCRSPVGCLPVNANSQKHFSN
jgi:hypothetical protein